MGTYCGSLYGAQTLVTTGPVHALHIYRGVSSSEVCVGMSKQEKTNLKLESARLHKAHRRNSTWTDGVIKDCESIANRYLGHTQGCRSDELRTSPPAICELPSTHLGDYSAQSPIVHLIP